MAFLYSQDERLDRLKGLNHTLRIDRRAEIVWCDLRRGAYETWHALPLPKTKAF